MSSLDSLLRPAASMINRQIRARTPARELCKELDGRVMAIRVTNTALAMYLIVEEDQVLLSADYAEDPEVVVSGSLFGLARLAGSANDEALRDGSVQLTGDTVLANQFQKLLGYGRPDIEEELSDVIGDAAAHGIGEFVRGIGEWSREAGATMRQNVSEYLNEESRAVPTRDEVDMFRGKVDSLSDDLARFEARLRAFETDVDCRGKT